MTGFILIILVAAAAHGIAALLRLPVIPMYLLGGIALQWVGGNGVQPENWVTAVELGLIFLVFFVGIELNPKRINRQLNAVWRVGLFQFFAVGLLGYLIAYALGYSQIEAIYITFALSASSTLVVVRLLKQRQQMFEPYARLVSGVLLLQDVFIIVILVLLLRSGAGPEAMAWGLGATLLLGMLAWIGHRWLIQLVIVRMRQDEETLLLTVLTTLFIFVGLAHLLELPLAVGAFMGGFVLSAFPVSGIVRGMVSSLSGFFMALFFTALGGLIVIPSLGMLLDGLILGVCLIVITVPLVTWVAERAGISARSAIESGLLLSQTSEFSLILVFHGFLLNQISGELFSLVVLMTAGTMALTPFLSHDRVAIFLMRLHPWVGNRWQLPEDLKDHVVILGYSRAGDYMALPVRDAGCPVVVVDDDPVIVRRLKGMDIHAVAAEASDEKTLKRVHADKARLVIVALRRFSDAAKILKFLKPYKVKVWVRVFDESQAAEIERSGGKAIMGVHKTIERFMEWIKKELPQDDKAGED
ncbi:MAG: cation:proton antiporter [Opitutales bacterium]|nr:cation:proton antiporter [Opitutales bacterium]